MMRDTPRTFVGTTSFRVGGMTGQDSADAMAAVIAGLPGIAGVSFDPGAGSVVITTDRPLERGDVAAALEGAGLTLHD